MALFRAAPTEAEMAALAEAIKRRLEESKLRLAQLKDPAANPAPPAEPAQPADMQVVWGKSMRRWSKEEVEAVAGYWRNNYAQYDDPEIARLGEEKLVAALTADGYEVPKRKETDRLQFLLNRHAGKGS